MAKKIELEKTDIHADVLRVKNVPRGDSPDAKRKRANIASTLRTAAKREGGSAKVSTRGENVFVATSKAGEDALPKIEGRGAGNGLKLADLVAQAKSA